MRRLLLVALTFALLAGTFAGVASARLSSDGPRVAKVAPFHAPAAAPREDATHPGTYGFRTAEALAARYAPATPAAAPATGGASATVTVTATVLPVVTIVIDEETGDVIEIVTNTPERNPRGVLYVVRVGSTEGDSVPLDADTWAAARAALAGAHAGTGTIFSA